MGLHEPTPFDFATVSFIVVTEKFYVDTPLLDPVQTAESAHEITVLIT